MTEQKKHEKSRKTSDILSSRASECVRVVVRVRPLGPKEDNMQVIATTDEGNATVTLKPLDKNDQPKCFTFDQVYGPNSQQKVIYDRTAATIVDSVCDGYNGTIFAYGQTGSGKTHTMEGLPSPPEERGIIPNSFRHIFEKIGVEGSEKKRYLVRASYLEIYNEEIRDLLSKDPKNRLELRENGDGNVYVKDLSVRIVNSVEEISKIMNQGKKLRHVGATLMNQTSSRSHSIFTIIVETSELDEISGETKIRVGKLNLVDLAGSERQSKTGASGQRLKEATKINLSLSALGNVISALVEPKCQHVPYRDSKLTRLLQDSLGGNTKTVMITNCGPADYNFDETLSTLRYANRAKKIRNKPKINEDPKDAMLREYQDEISRLREKLKQAETGESGNDGNAMEMADSTGNVTKMIGDERVGKMKKEFEQWAEKERQAIEEESNRKIKRMQQEQKISEKERLELAERLRKEGEQNLRAKQAKEAVQEKLKMMEEKLLIGGLMMDKAAKQEQELRRAEAELEERNIQQRLLARKVAEKEEEMLHKDEKYSSLQDEVEVKTKKIKKLWNKYQTARSEIKDLHDDFQREREDMTFTIRELTKQNRLCQMIIENFIPPQFTRRLLKIATYDSESDEYIIPHLEMAGNNIYPKRPYFGSSEPIDLSQIVDLDLEMPEITTRSYADAALDSSVQIALDAALAQEQQEAAIVFDYEPQTLPNPYMKLGAKKPSDSKQNHSKVRTKSSGKSSKKRPATAVNSRANRKKEEPKEEEIYPVAKGLVTRDMWD